MKWLFQIVPGLLLVISCQTQAAGSCSSILVTDRSEAAKDFYQNWLVKEFPQYADEFTQQNKNKSFSQIDNYILQEAQSLDNEFASLNSTEPLYKVKVQILHDKLCFLEQIHTQLKSRQDQLNNARMREIIYQQLKLIENFVNQ